MTCLPEAAGAARIADPMRPVPWRVGRVIRESADTFTLHLERNGDGFPFAPGQFNMLYVYGAGEVPISISGDPADPTRLVHTTRAVGAVTRAMQRLKPGDFVGVRGPFGTAWPVEEAEGSDVLIVAGGMGLAPLRPVVNTLIRNRQWYGRVIILYGTRSPSHILFRRDLEKWRARLDMNVFVSVDRGTAEWRNNVGVVTTLIPKAPFDPFNTVALICGPELMMRYTTQELGRRHIPPERIWVSMERNMKCAVGLCGHCQFGPYFVCKDGPVFPYPVVQTLFGRREV